MSCGISYKERKGNELKKSHDHTSLIWRRKDVFEVKKTHFIPSSEKAKKFEKVELPLPGMGKC